VASTRLRLRVVPGAARAGVVGRYRDGWKIRVAAPPDRGAANAAVVELLARTLHVRSRDISLVSGHGSRDKIVEVVGVGPTDSDARLASAERKDA
jgi:uncharacterized protein